MTWHDRSLPISLLYMAEQPVHHTIMCFMVCVHLFSGWCGAFQEANVSRTAQ